MLALQLPPLAAIALLLAATAIPMWWLELRRHPPVSNANALGAPPDRAAHLVDRLLGLAGTGLLFALSLLLQSQLAPEMIGGLYAWILPALPVIAAFCLWQIYRRPGLPSPVEELGIAIRCSLQGRRVEREDVQCLLGWVVKAFFLPLMLAWSYVWLAKASDPSSGDGWMAYFLAGMAWLYAIDTAFGTIGYMSTSRRIGAHIRSVDSTLLGWLSALVCYPPLSLLVLRQWLEYKDGLEWDQWLHGHAYLAIAWGSAILLLTAIYTWATVVFGPRFSNLTHRGIITSGPFRFTKHPAYICKNLSWWLISVPFVSAAGTRAAVLNCLALLGVNAIYWLRAKTEERHLMRDPVYQQYAAWIAHNGIFGRCRRLFVRAAR